VGGFSTGSAAGTAPAIPAATSAPAGGFARTRAGGSRGGRGHQLDVVVVGEENGRRRRSHEGTHGFAGEGVRAVIVQQIVLLQIAAVLILVVLLILLCFLFKSHLRLLISHFVIVVGSKVGNGYGSHRLVRLVVTFGGCRLGSSCCRLWRIRSSFGHSGAHSGTLT